MTQKADAIKHIIIQAGGQGTRLGYLTRNKPKALVSISGEPLIIKQMKHYPQAHFYIIVDYKAEVLEKYLKLYASTSYKIIRVSGKKTCSGIQASLKFIPQNEPLLIIWCDLYFKKRIYPKTLNIFEDNYIGLSQTFPCRWKFEHGKLLQENSSKRGIAGVFILKNKKELGKVPENGALTQFLAKQKINFTPYFLKDVYEIGTLNSYYDLLKDFFNTRPFNRLVIKGPKVYKYPKDSQGKKLAKLEAKWYRHQKKYKYSFLPKVYQFSPLILEKINGNSLYKNRFTKQEKEKLLTEIVKNLQAIHFETKEIKSTYENDYDAILGKTKNRLDSISSLIPDIKSDIITINGKKCMNFYKKWNTVEKILKRYFPDTYCILHGDLTFSNILYEENKKQVYFIDPRGYYGKVKMYGDEDYDWAKLYYSLVGNYDQFNSKNFQLQLGKNEHTISINSNSWEDLEDFYFKLIKRDPKKIHAYHAIIWLSLTSYSWDDYDAICGAFYNGIYLMQNFYENTL